MKMKIDHVARYDTIRPTFRQYYKYSKYKKVSQHNGDYM